MTAVENYGTLAICIQSCGGTSGAVKHYAETSKLVGESTHIITATERVTSLGKLLKTPSLFQSDIEIANILLKQLKDALSLIK